MLHVFSHMQEETIFKLTCVLCMYTYTYEYNMYTQVEREPVKRGESDI